MKQYKKLAINTVFFALGNIGSKSIQFLLLPLFTRYMVPSEYGKLDIINTTISLLVPVLSFQIMEAVLRFTIELRVEQKNKDLLPNALIFSVLAFLFSVLVYPVLRSISIFSEYSVYFYIMFFLTIIKGIVKQYIRGIEMIKLYVLSDIFYSLVFAASSSVLLIMFRLGVKGYLLSNIVSLFSASLLIFSQPGCTSI